MEFEPAYEDIGGIKHEFTGLLWTPAPGEKAKIERKQAEENPPDLTDFWHYVTTVVAPFPILQTRNGVAINSRVGRAKMSAADLIRISTSRTK